MVKSLLLMTVFIMACAFAQPKTTLQEAFIEEIEVGGGILHLRDLYEGRRGNSGFKYYFKPMLVLAHDGFIGGYFKNSHWQDSFFIGLRRYWQSIAYKNITILPGYAFGAVSGYCKGNKFDFYDDCNNGRKWQLAPYGQLFLKFKKDNFSVNIGYSFVVTYLTASYYLN